jgi:membrane protein required for colicin V production
VDQNVHILPAKQKEQSKIYDPMKQVVPTLLPFIKLWDLKDHEKEDPKQEPKSKTKTT